MKDLDRAPTRAANRATILRMLLSGESITRVRLADRTGLSRPTVNAIVEDLHAEGLVEEAGIAGTAGRSATIFRLATRARTVIGIDLGGARTRAAIADITGRVIVEREVPTDAATPGLVARLARLCREMIEEAAVEPASLAAVAMGTPGVADPISRRIRFAANIPELADIDLRLELATALDVPVVLDNDVNMAVVGERWRGLAQGSANVVFIAVGKGLGMGIIAGGMLQRGHSGAAGEVGFLPLAANAFDGVDREFGPIEELVSSRGVVEAYQRAAVRSSEPALTESLEVFSAARRGSAAALEAIDEVARWLALVISSAHAVLDPERVIIGGGVGSDELFASALRAHLGRLGRRPPVVERSALGGQAALLGALSVATHSGQDSIGAGARAVLGDG